MSFVHSYINSQPYAEASEPGAEMEGVEHRERGRVGLCQSD